ncbi:hypothetical protein D3C80_1247240 [compost metagenome]
MNCTSEIDSRIDTEESFITLSVTEAGSSAVSAGSFALTASTTATVLASGWRCTASTMADWPSYQLPASRFSTLSSTRAISPRWIGAPLGEAITSERNSCALVRWVSALIVSFWLPFCSEPTGAWLLAASIAFVTLWTPRPRACSLSGSTSTRTA